MMHDANDELLSTESVAGALDCSERQVRTWIKAGLLRGVRLVGRWRVPVAEVERIKREGLTARGQAA